MERYLYVAGTLAFTLYGQVMLRFRAGALSGLQGGQGRFAYLARMFTDPGVLSGLIAAVAASICWMLAVRSLPLAVAYPFMALSFVLVPLAGYALMGEPLTTGQIVGALLIVLGVLVSSLFQATPI